MRPSAALTLFLLSPMLVFGLPVASSAHLSTPPDTTATQAPRLEVRVAARNLSQVWDVQPAPGRRLLVTERDRARISVVRNGKRRTLANLSRLVWVSGETGLMSMAVDPAARVLWACHGATTARGPEVRVTRWQVSRAWRSLSGRRTVISGLPASSGRHGGCRLLLDQTDGSLWIGTGDAAQGTNPRNLDSLGGKVLRVNAMTGAPMPTNPWARTSGNRRFVWTFGHRNVQGLARRADGSVWSVEHGSCRDDEVNRLVPGGDYGWNPVPGYNESVPMTDHALPGTQQSAAWSSGTPTIATSGAAWVRGGQWGTFQGTLAVAALKGSRVVFMHFDSTGRLLWSRQPAALRRFGRLRSVTSLANGDLLVTTANGSGDQVLRVSAR